MASLVIDWGYVNLTRVQMQSVVDAGAVEGLRLRDAAPDDPATPNNPATRDQNRRDAVSRLATWTYDDNFVKSAGDSLQFGAGPDVTLSGGKTDLNASQILSVSASPVYKPSLQLNLQNLVNGDLVSGTFRNSGLECPNGKPGIECADYTRKDFVPADVDDSQTASAFLVRLRRSVKPEPVQDTESQDSTSGVSSAGPTLPLMFGLGSLLQPESDSSGIRHTGITVRATAIADARPARGVGLPDSTPRRLGVTPFALDRVAWRDRLSVNTPLSCSVSGTGEITFEEAVIGQEETVIGQFVSQVLSIGQPVQPNPPAAGSITINGYSPLYQDILGTPRIVGFARIQMSGTIPGDVQVIKRSAQVAAENATSTIPPTFPIGLQPQELTLLFQAHRTLQNEEALMAPVLVR